MRDPYTGARSSASPYHSGSVAGRIADRSTPPAFRALLLRQVVRFNPVARARVLVQVQNILGTNGPGSIAGIPGVTSDCDMNKAKKCTETMVLHCSDAFDIDTCTSNAEKNCRKAHGCW